MSIDESWRGSFAMKLCSKTSRKVSYPRWLQREIYITSIYFNILCLIRAHLKREICSLVGWWWINKLHIISLDWKCIVRLLNVPYYLLLYAISILFFWKLKWNEGWRNLISLEIPWRNWRMQHAHFLIFIKMLSCSNVKLYSNQFSLPIAHTVDDLLRGCALVSNFK